MKQSRKTIIALVAACLMVAGAAANDECDAEVSATLDRQEESKLQFSVDVSTGESCAHIEYDLVIEVQLANAQTKRIRKPRQVKLNDGSLTEIVDHRLAGGERMLSYEAKVVKCRTCDLGA